MVPKFTKNKFKYAVHIFILIFVHLVLCEEDQDIQLENYPLTIQICDVCSCKKVGRSENVSDMYIDILCSNTLKNVPSIQSMLWPNNDENLFMEVVYEGLGWTSIEKVPENHHLTSLSFNNNAISFIGPGAFANLKSLKYLQLSNNNLLEIPPDVFQNLIKLVQLDLSHNKLNIFNHLEFSELKSLSILNLKHNFITEFPIDLLIKIPSLQEIDLSENQIFFLNLENNFEQSDVLKNLKYLDLSFNKLSVIYNSNLKVIKNLEILNLSNNAIASIEQNFFNGNPNLKIVDLSYNSLTTLSDLPHNIDAVYLQHNLFKTWPSLPENVKILDLSQNSLTETYDGNYVSLNKLEYLNISHNIMAKFDISQPFPILDVLDLSYNRLHEIPQVLSTENFPRLEELILDGNPMKKLIFTNDIELKRLSANYMYDITTIDASGFIKLHTKENNETDLGCIDLSISHCNKLVNINENSFQGLKLCHLDISYNNLTTLTENVADWTNTKYGVNLQGNPWDCQCSLQWFLDILLKDLYINHPVYLHELRCESPRAVRGLRLVHWYKRDKNILCRNDRGVRFSSNYVLQPSTSDTDSGEVQFIGGAVIGILVAIIIGIILIIALIAYLAMGKYKHNKNVRQLMKRKRQSMTDAKRLNSNNGNVNSPLNTV